MYLLYIEVLIKCRVLLEDMWNQRIGIDFC